MGTGQLLLTIVAIVLLGTIILRTNANIITTSQTLATTNYGIEAVSLATTIIEDAQALPFDQHDRNGEDINSPNGFDTPANLGQESAIGDTLDDFDDYNGNHGNKGSTSPGRTYTYALATGNYVALTKVKYVMYNPVTKTLDFTTGAAQWSKRLDVWVWNTIDSLDTVYKQARTDTVHMYTVQSYW